MTTLTSSPSTGHALAIEVQALVKTYGRDVRALDGLTFAVPEGTIFGLLGPNGAGKSTTVKILNTLSRPDSGIARVAGLDVVAQPDAVRRAVGCVAQKSGVDINATGRENLTLQAQFYGLTGSRLKQRVSDLLGAVFADDGRQSRGARLLRRHETETRHRDGPGAHAARPRSSTSRPPASIPSRAPISGRRSHGCHAKTGSPCSSPPITWRRPTSSPARSRSWIAGASSPKAHRMRSRASCPATPSTSICSSRRCRPHHGSAGAAQLDQGGRRRGPTVRARADNGATALPGMFTALEAAGATRPERSRHAAVARRCVFEAYGTDLHPGRSGRCAMTALRHSWYMAVRHMRSLARQPWWIAISLAQPVTYLVLYGQLFKRVVELPGFQASSYITFVTPGVVIMMALFGGGWNGMGIIFEIDSGVMDRFLVSPVSRFAILAGPPDSDERADGHSDVDPPGAQPAHGRPLRGRHRRDARCCWPPGCWWACPLARCPTPWR